MVRLDKIYTRGGDDGKTSLGGGARVDKHSPRVNAYGTVDEANSILGLARITADKKSDAILARVQNDLFDLGADLCRPSDDETKETSLRISKSQIQRLEDEIDSLNEELKPLNSFILPGGTDTASWLHLGRTVVRRCERLITELATCENVNLHAIKYINRLSDLLFVLARTANENGKKDVLWKPGDNQ